MPPAAPRRCIRLLASALALSALLSGPVAAATIDPADRAHAARILARDFGIEAFDLVMLDAPVERDGELVIEVPIDGADRMLDLQPFSLRAREFRVLVADGSGALRPIEAAPPRTWRGTVRGMPGGVAAASLLPAGIRGTIVPPSGPAWRIVPLGGRDAKLPRGLHAVWRSDARADGFGLCGVTGDGPAALGGVTPPPSGPAGPSCLRLAEIAWDADHEFFLVNDSDVDATVDAIEATMNEVDPIYARDVLVTYAITTIVVRADPDDPYSGSDAGGRLDQLRDEWNTTLVNEPRDMVHLATGRNMGGGIIGLAYVGVVCNLGFAYGLSHDADVAVVAHELGHNWNAPHCLDDICGIMCGNCVREFGELTTNIMMDHRATRTCLDPAAAYPLPVPPRARLDRAETVGAITIDVLADDHDGNCDPVSIESFDATSAAGGTISLSPGTGEGGRDELIYEPPADFGGLDTFTYRVADGTGLVDEGPVEIEVFLPRPPDEPRQVRPGVATSYFDADVTSLPDFDLLTPYLRTVEPRVDWPATEGEIAGSGRTDLVAVTLEGLIDVPADAIYVLSLESDDGSALYVGDDLVVDHDGLHVMTEESGRIALARGLHRVRIEYFERTGSAGLIARIEGGGLGRQVIPDERWFHDPGLVLRASPLRAGEQGRLEARFAPPGERVWFAYSLTGEGSTVVDALGVTLDLDGAVEAGSAIADGAGTARLAVDVPAGAGLRLVWLQAAIRGETSDVLLEQVNP